MKHGFELHGFFSGTKIRVSRGLAVIPADIAKKNLNHPVNPCKHLQCKDLDLANVYAVLYWVQKVLRCSDFLSPMNWHYVTHTYSEYPWLQ